MSAAVSVEKQRKITKKKPRGKPFEKGNDKGFKAGKSGNPGGQQKGAIYLSEAYKRLMVLTPAQLKTFKPKNVAEEMALKQIKRALDSEDHHAINATEKIADRTEGKPLQAVRHEGSVNVNLDSRQVAQRMLDKLLNKGISEDEARQSLLALGVDERDIPTLQTA